MGSLEDHSNGEDSLATGPPTGITTTASEVISDYALQAELEPDGPPAVVLATAGYDHTIRFWDVVRGGCIGTLQHNESQVNCLALTRDKLLIAAGGNPAVRLYDTVAATRLTEEGIVNSTANVTPLHVFEGHSCNVMSVGFASDGRWMWSASEDGTLRVWGLSPPDYACQREIFLGVPITAAALHPDGTEIYIVDAEGWLRVWDLATNNPVCEHLVEEGIPLRCLSLSSDQHHVAVVDHRGRLHLWRIYTLTNSSSPNDESNPCAKGMQLHHLCTIQAHETFAIKCLFSPDSSSILTTSADGTAKLWKITSSTSPQSQINNNQSQEEDSPSNHLSSSSDLSAGSARATLVLAQTFIGHNNWLWDAAFSADSAYIVTAASDNTARLWDVQTAETISIYTGHGKALICVALNDLPIV